MSISRVLIHFPANCLRCHFQPRLQVVDLPRYGKCRILELFLFVGEGGRVLKTHFNPPDPTHTPPNLSFLKAKQSHPPL